MDDDEEEPPAGSSTTEKTEGDNLLDSLPLEKTEQPPSSASS